MLFAIEFTLVDLIFQIDCLAKFPVELLHIFYNSSSPCLGLIFVYMSNINQLNILVDLRRIIFQSDSRA